MLKEIVIICTKGQLSYVEHLELQVNAWLAQSLQTIAQGEKKKCELVIAQNDAFMDMEPVM